MKIFAETERLILRELLPSDDSAMFELDSNAEVHKYLGKNPIQSIEKAREYIELVRQQYTENGVGRWAAIEKTSGDFIGWSGLKLVKELENGHINFYDVGYRLIPRYWGKGYATESAKAALEYGFTKLKLSEIIGTANKENKASRHALEKCGLKFKEQFLWRDMTCDWLKITKEEWLIQQGYKITKLKNLSPKQAKQINALWNAEYPLKLKDRFPILLDGVEHFNHYLIEDAQQNVLAWAVDFEKDNEIRFSIIVDERQQGKGFGAFLMDKLKAANSCFYGWVIDHNEDLKSNGNHYQTPMPFYLKHGFEIMPSVRIESEMIRAVKIKWKSNEA